MKVTDAVRARRSVRAFLERPVDAAALRDALALAARAPSGGNLQPWRIHVLGGDVLRDFKAKMQQRWQQNPTPDAPDYAIYPAHLGEPYRSHRYQVGEAMYERLNIGRDNKWARLQWLMRNYDFFGAPVGLFCSVDRKMGAAQWSDLGMYLQTLMLLLQERGIDTCPQEIWSVYHRTVADFIKLPDELMLFCGMAIGHADPDAPVNELLSKRASLDDFTQFLGI